MGHVAKGIQVHEAGHGGDHDQHDRGQTVQPDRPIGAQRAAFDPAQDLDVLGRAVKVRKTIQLRSATGTTARAIHMRAVSPMIFQPKPQISAPTSGAKRMMVSMSLALHHVDVFNGDGAAVAEETDQNGQTNRRLGSGNGQHEQGKHLPDQIAQEAGEGDQVDVHRQQHQFDAHQQDDHVLAVQEKPERCR